jgi:hypothetical protein
LLILIFPIVLRPWWMALITIVLFVLILKARNGAIIEKIKKMSLFHPARLES